MGYSTDFYGALQLSRPATEQEKNYINLFSGTRRMKRDIVKLMELYKGQHGLPNFAILTDEQKDLLQKLTSGKFINKTNNIKNLKFNNPLLGLLSQIADKNRKVIDIEKQTNPEYVQYLSRLVAHTARAYYKQI